MSERKYIGARYVPLFADPLQWDNTRAYEPLTIVLNNGNSYTSRQYVPIGIDIANSDYWALSADYNAAIQNIDNIIPSSEFSSANTVKDYVDAGLNTVDAEIDALAAKIPDTDFTSENTVKDYIDGEIQSVLDVFPASDFSSTNTVKSKFDYIEYDGIGYKNGIETNFIYNIVRFSKSKYIVNFALNTENDGSTASPLIDYARRERPVFCSNVSNSSSFVFDGTVYGSDYAAPDRAAFYCKHNTSEEDFTIVRCDGTTTQRDMLALGWNFVGGGWQALVYGGVQWSIANYQTFTEYNPHNLFAWDDDYYYFSTIYGRLIGKPGVLLSEAQTFAIAQGWNNCVAMDGGDSIRHYFAEYGVIPTTKRLNIEKADRTSYYNMTVYRKGQ